MGREISAIRQLNHPNFVRYFDFKENSTYYKRSGITEQVTYIVQEYVQGGELYSYLASIGPFSAGMCRHYFKEML